MRLNLRRTLNPYLASILARLLFATYFLAASASNATESLAIFLVTHHHGDGDLHTHDVHAIEDDRTWAAILILGSALAFGLAVFLCVRYY